MDENKEQSADEQEAPKQSVQESVQVQLPPKPVAQELPKTLVNEPKTIASPVSGKLDRFKSFVLECKRVLRVTKKPDKAEFVTIVKISALGMAIIGIIGFLIHFAKELLF